MDIKSYVLVAVQFITAIAILHPVPVAACSMLLVVQGCALALAVWAIVIVAYLALIAVTLLAKRSYPMGSEEAQAVLRQEPD